MQAYSFLWRIGSIWAAAGAVVLYGCAVGGDSADIGSTGTSAAPASAADPSRNDRPASEQPVAIVDGVAVRLGDLAPALMELAGAEALAEAVLDRRLASRAAEAGVAIEATDIERERTLLASTLSDDPDTSARLLRELRTRQGLGPARFEALLRRNAMLRTLVADEVEVNEAAVRRTFDLLYGERRQPRIIIVSTLREAEEVVQRLRDGGRSFADLAIERSTDASAARGGLLAPISAADPSYPQALRTALATLALGGVSSPIMLEGGYALLKLERIIPVSDAATTLDFVHDEVAELARRNQERLLMQDLAGRLINDRRISIIDDVLREAWQRRE